MNTSKGSVEKIDIYLEVGNKKTFAGAIDWPGWCRSARDEQSALQSLLEYGPRYALALKSIGPEFHAPQDLTAFMIIERIKGSVTTDFGAPDMPPLSDDQPINDRELERYQSILRACWSAFDQAVMAATGKELRKGSRGGGRELQGIVEHVIGAERAYHASIGGKFKMERGDPEPDLQSRRHTILETLTAAAHSELPQQGPRGGKYWTPRYFVRRAAWHILDHAWEIEDRIL